MAVSVGSGAQGRRKSLDAEINLVPFIDLLSMCICFLLMTAVWLEVGALQVKQSHGTEAAAAASDSYEMDLKFTAPLSVEVALKKGKARQTLQFSGASSQALVAHLDAGLSAWMKSAAKGRVQSSLVSAAMLTPSAAVPYGDLVAVMDVLRKNQIINLGVVPVKVK